MSLAHRLLYSYSVRIANGSFFPLLNLLMPIVHRLLYFTLKQYKIITQIRLFILLRKKAFIDEIIFMNIL